MELPARGTPLIPLTLYILLSTLTCLAYGFDKLAARRGGARVSEATLHLLALCGGWPGALCGQRFFRHKTQKWTFQLTFFLTVLLNSTLLCAWVLYG